MPEPGIAAATAAAAASRTYARAGRRRQATVIERGWGNEYMDLEDDLEEGPGSPSEGSRVAATAASYRGAGSLGFAGTAKKERTPKAAGLATLAGNEFGGGPRMPMLPGTWDRTDAGDPEEGE